MKKTILNIATVVIISSLSFIACKDFMKPTKNKSKVDSTSVTKKDSLSLKKPGDSMQTSKPIDTVKVETPNK